MPPNMFTRFLRLRSTSSDSSHTTKSGVPSAMVEALDRVDSRSTLAGTTTSSAQVTCSSDIERQLQGSARLSTRSVLTSPLSETTKDVVAAVRGDKHAKDKLGDGTEEDAVVVQYM